MESKKSILHELYVFSEWKPEPEYLQKPDTIFPDNLSALWCWLNFFGSKKSLLDSVSAHKEQQQKWHIALGDMGKVIAVLTDNILEIRTKRTDYATITARTTVIRDAFPQWRKVAWSPDCTFLAVAYGNGIVSFFDLAASNLFNIPADCSRPGGRECSDNTHAIADIIFMPLRVKDNKWNWEVLLVTYDGKLRGYLVSLTEGFKLHHSFRLAGAAGGVSAAIACLQHNSIYVAGVPHVKCKDPTSPLNAGITAWRILNDDPFYKLSVVSDQIEGQLVKDNFQMFIPFVGSKNLAFIVRMELSPDGSKLVCLHCNGDISVWRLPVLKLLYRWPLATQPLHDLQNPLVKVEKQGKKDLTVYHAADVNWWSNEEIILSRFSGAVTVCDIQDMYNILGKKPEFFQGSPQVTAAHEGTFMALECETNILPARRSRSDDSMEMVSVETETEDTVLELMKEMVKGALFSLTDMERFQPRPRRITVLSRVYRLLGVKSTTPQELFERKIESGHYTEALALAESFGLDTDRVYQQQWRKNPVSTDAIQNYLSKVCKKIWAVHQCVDRLPETLPAAKQLLQFGLELTNQNILEEINKERTDKIESHEDITLEDLNAFTSELLRCRHVMLFYTERLKLYEAILRCEKSTYVKEEYDRLRSHSMAGSAGELAREGRVDALACLWPHLTTTAVQLTVLQKLPETMNPLEYSHLLPMVRPLHLEGSAPYSAPYSAPESAPESAPDSAQPAQCQPPHDWCRKEIFRSIWSSNWSEDSTPDGEKAEVYASLGKWYEQRAREIEQRCGIVSHALTLVTLAAKEGGVTGLDDIMFHLLTLDTLVYDINVEGVSLGKLEKMSTLETCTYLMKMSTPTTFVADLKKFVIPFLKRYENLTKRTDACLNGLIDYLESISVDDLSLILLVLQSPSSFELDVRTHLEIAERCLYAHSGTDQLDKACDILATILQESDGSISDSSLIRRVKEMECVVGASSRLSGRGVSLPLRRLRDTAGDLTHAANILTRVARSLAIGEVKPTQQDWEKLLNDILDLQSTLFTCITKEQCYEIYASALLTSGDASSIKLSAGVLTCGAASAPRTANGNGSRVTFPRSVQLVLQAAKEYFNSASSLNDPALELAKCCLQLIKDTNNEIQEELDLISALHILSSFKMTVLPIQVRLCEERMKLIDECLSLEPRAYLASHKLLKLAQLLRIAGDDERAREGQVLQRLGEFAVSVGAGGSPSCVQMARRLCALRCAAAHRLVAHVAAHAHAHADNNTRRDLLAAAATHAPPEDIEEILRMRLNLELESLQQMGAALKEHGAAPQRCPSADDEFADAVTTPVIEKKDLVAPPPAEKKPLLNYLLDTLQNKFITADKTSSSDSHERRVHCPEFYRSIYAHHAPSSGYYAYDSFAAATDDELKRAHAALNWFYIQNCDGDVALNQEIEVVQKCANELIYKDTPLSVACLLQAMQLYDESCDALSGHSARTAVCTALYAALLRTNVLTRGEEVYLAEPAQICRTTLNQKQTKEDPYMDIIMQCIDKLTVIGEVEKLKKLGFSVNGPLFSVDEDYRKEIIYRVAKSREKKHLSVAQWLACKYKVDAVEVWVEHARADPTLAHLAPPSPSPSPPTPTPPPPALGPTAHARIKEALWDQVQGDDHTALMTLFTILKSVDEKAPICGLPAADHIKLLKKAKAASPELDYKLLASQPSAEEFSSHILKIMKPETAGLLTKFLRSAPPAFKLPVPVNAIYTMWLTKYFFSVPPAAATSKKWMQQYRQCASYFNKLAKDDLLQFLTNTCFSAEAIERVPAGSRSLMIMQAVDYCQQEHENEIKLNKNEQSWAQVGQELSRWARFLDNLHSDSVQGIVEVSGLPKDSIWPEIEMSHGDPAKLIPQISLLIMTSELRAASLTSLLQCLHCDATADDVFAHIADNRISTAQEVETLVDRVIQYNKDGIKFSEEVIEKILEKCREYKLPALAQMRVLALRRGGAQSGHLAEVAQFTAHLVRAEWGMEVTEETLMNQDSRNEIFKDLMKQSDTLSRKKALVDILVCWPPTREGDSRSTHAEYARALLSAAGHAHRETLVLIKLLLRRPIFTDEEVKWLTDAAKGDSVINAVWVILLSKGESYQDDILSLLERHKDTIKIQDVEDELVKELLDNGMFLKLVATPLYTAVVNYVINNSSVQPPLSEYTVDWAMEQLKNANFLAEAGHLHLMTMGVPSPLRGFSETVLYMVNNMLTKK